MDTVVGKTLTDMVPRDAIHIAVAPVIAGCRLHAGQHVSFDYNSTDTVTINSATPIGIVDPFLTEVVEPGTIFWLFLYPNTITSLKHLWTHPAFNHEDADKVYVRPEKKITSEQWLKNYAEGLNVGYRDLMNSATEWIEYGEYMCRGGLLEGVCTGDEFWEHFENVTGTKVVENKKENFFTCSC